MAEFQKVMADAKRMYSAQGDENKPIYIGEISFEDFEIIVEQWAAEHPIKTNRMILDEYFPNRMFETDCMFEYTGKSPTGGCNDTNCDDCKRDWLDSEYKGGDA